MEVKLSLCKRKNTCYECDNKECLRCGDIEQDCPLIHCQSDGNCKECIYNENNIIKKG